MAGAAANMTGASMAQLYSLEVESDGSTKKCFSVVSIPAMTSLDQCSSNYYNIAMFDVSASMYHIFDDIMDAWNSTVALSLTGETDLYTFGANVKFRRRGIFYTITDNDRCNSTNLTGALAVINEKVRNCKHNFIRIFLITDGAHNFSYIQPDSEIAKMTTIPGKIIEVYLLGVGRQFPVQYSVDIRSRLHNGSASCPTLFWIEDVVQDQLSSIQEEVKRGALKASLSIPARVIPYVNEMQLECSSGEYLFFDMEPTALKKELKIRVGDGELQIMDYVEEASVSFLVGNLFRQWNAVMIQRHRNRQSVPTQVFDLMQKLFDTKIKSSEAPGAKLSERLQKKEMRGWVNDFNRLMNESRNMISVMANFSDEIKLAEAILKTTVQTKYDTKLLKMKGHHNEDWAADTEEFKKRYLSIKEQIMALPTPGEDDCCRVLISSFLSDLQDPKFLDVLDESKADFLSTMTFTGIPILAPVKDSVQINPWTLYIKNICVSPFEILSQRAMESSFAVGANCTNSTDKEIELHKGNPGSVFNAIVPIIPKQHCQLLKNLVRTNVFSVGATFCILKNALIVDHNCHFAALGCVWMKTIKDHPAATRPEYIKKRISDIEETAKLYLDRPAISNYISGLLTKPKLGLMTEANEDHGGRTLKCESMVKPAFILHLAKDKIMSRESQVTCKQVLQMILVEFLGRCLSNDTSSTPYMDLLSPHMTPENRQQWLDQICEQVMERLQLTGDSLLETCFTPQEVPRHTRRAVLQHFESMMDDDGELRPTPVPNEFRLVRMRNSGSAGHVGWEDLRAWAQEMAADSQQDEGGAAGGVPLITQEDIDAAFSPEMVVSYLHHALQHRQSRGRFESPLLSGAAAADAVIARLLAEQKQLLKNNLLATAEKVALEKWRESYNRCHRNLAKPLTREQIIEQATARGVPVNRDNFNTIYKYRHGVGMCRNCCHVESCPHFLQPHRNFNCHLEEERSNPNYPHTLHLVVSRNRSSPAQSVELVRSGSETGTNDRPKPDKPEEEAEDVLREMVNELDKEYNNMG